MIEIDWKPDRHKLEGFALISAVVFGAVGAWIFFRHAVFGIRLGEPAAGTTAYVLWCLAAACLAARLSAPKVILPLYLLLTAIGAPVGYVVSHVLMGIVYYGVLTPIGLVLRFVRRDPLQRRFDRRAATYWVKRAPATGVGRYFRQF